MQFGEILKNLSQEARDTRQPTTYPLPTETPKAVALETTTLAHSFA